MFTKCFTCTVWSSMYSMQGTDINTSVSLYSRPDGIWWKLHTRLTSTQIAGRYQIWCQRRPICFFADFRWHLGSCTSECLPTRRGFDEFKGIIEGQADYFNWRKLLLIGSYSRITTLSLSIFFLMGNLSSHTKCANNCPTIESGIDNNITFSKTLNWA